MAGGATFDRRIGRNGDQADRGQDRRWPRAVTCASREAAIRIRCNASRPAHVAPGSSPRHRRSRFASSGSRAACSRWASCTWTRARFVRSAPAEASCLPVLRRSTGRFDRGDPVVVRGPDGAEIARGLSAYSSADAERIRGRRSQDLESLLGFAATRRPRTATTWAPSLKSSISSRKFQRGLWPSPGPNQAPARTQAIPSTRRGSGVVDLELPAEIGNRSVRFRRKVQPVSRPSPAASGTARCGRPRPVPP